MAATRSHAPSQHGKLHKRGNSASSINNPKTSSELAGYNFNRFDTPRATYEEPWEPARPTPAASNPLKIKPYLRKLSVKDTNTLDLSRPAAENERLAGLGIHEYGAGSRNASDVSFAPVNSRTRHNRSTSNTSQFSTSSSLQRPTAPYMPLRQPSRPYTPPQSKSKSSPASMIGSEGDEADDIMSDEEMRYRQNMFDPTRRSGSISSTQAQALRVTTSGSSTRLGSYSQTSLSLASPPTRPRGDTLKSIDTASPSSRPSLDKAFGFIRGGRDSPVDPASRAASIRAARQAYQEKEAAKDAKAEKEAMKQADRESKKKYKQEERQRRKSDAAEKRTLSVSQEKVAASVAGKEYSNYAPAHTRSLPARVATIDPEKEIHAAPPITGRRLAKGRWANFVTWFRTRMLRLGKRLHMA
ncbi:uncharacterized protein BDZ99DRAFT_486433 [Mytilinidion resinicola]|uniref:Uncharacterized protein n=1 Tax=Mytilinidion resinicola TaxID=574789 RepID=A0A6A6YYQ9_9PEZI|nr:uncharacterized protein BDZ99DRAFT_486433 [Mytilinidion resinicola]KAF2813065.1 hypothetical protein BDZ99DRAFT_486433 [Mytilinidion resinicola]